jgi:acetyl esterase
MRARIVQRRRLPMTSRHLVDPETSPVIDLFQFGELTREALPDLRQLAARQFRERLRPRLAPKRILAAASHDAPDVEILIYDPPRRETLRPAILHVHGGGMVLGSAYATSEREAELALDKNIVIASVEYRLAPETPFPGPQEDCYAALAWLIANAAALRIDPDRIALAGDSAGGGLAAAVALMARDRAQVMPCAQLLTYPMLDHRTGAPIDPYRNPVVGEFVWTASKNQFGWNCLKGDYALDDTRIGWFSPMRADDLSGLPPTWIGVGALDLFFDEDLEFARRLCAAGVEVELHCYPGAVHGFTVLPGTRLGRQFTADYGAAIDRLLFPAT